MLRIMLLTAVLTALPVAAQTPKNTAPAAPATGTAPAAGLADCPPFEALRKLETDKIAAKENKSPEPKPSKPELRTELLAMQQRDQTARANASGSAKANGGRPDQPLILAIFQADQDNVSRLREIVDAGGLPNAAEVGRDGLRAAWLVAQHADRDPPLQAKLLDAFKPLVAKGDMVPQDVALLTDRVRITQNQPQVYGSQFRPVNGISHPQPIEKPEAVEARRAEAGLLSMREYGCLLQQFHGIPVDLTPHETVLR